MLNRIFSPLLMAVVLTIFSLPHAMAESTMEDFSSETPYGSYSAGDFEAIAASTRDANFNRVVANTQTTGASASAIGNLINVVVDQGSQNNTIVINASQLNTGSQQATINTPLGSRSGSSANQTNSSPVLILGQ